jgi:hypothetical protein
MRSRRLTLDHCNRMLVVTSVKSSGTVGTTQALYSLLVFADEETKSLPRAEFICEEQRELFFMQGRLDCPLVSFYDDLKLCGDSRLASSSLDDLRRQELLVRLERSDIPGPE